MEPTKKVKTTKNVQIVKKIEKIKVEYDGYYLLDCEMINGFKFKIPSRGYNLKSWYNFENSLSSSKSCTFRLVSEEEYMKYHWTTHDISEKKPKKEKTPDPIKTKRISDKANTIMDFLN